MSRYIFFTSCQEDKNDHTNTKGMPRKNKTWGPPGAKSSVFEFFWLLGIPSVNMFCFRKLRAVLAALLCSFVSLSVDVDEESHGLLKRIPFEVSSVCPRGCLCSQNDLIGQPKECWYLLFSFICSLSLLSSRHEDRFQYKNTHMDHMDNHRSLRVFALATL